MILTDLPVEMSVELVLRAQGLKPDLVKTKSPKLIEITKKAIEIGSVILEPRVVFERYPIQSFTSKGVALKNGKSLEGELISTHFKNCRNIAVAICTVGSKIDDVSSETFHQNAALAMALEVAGKASDKSLLTAWAAEEPQQFQSSISTSWMPKANDIPLTDSLYSFAVPLSEQPG